MPAEDLRKLIYGAKPVAYTGKEDEIQFLDGGWTRRGLRVVRRAAMSAREAGGSSLGIAQSIARVSRDEVNSPEISSTSYSPRKVARGKK